MNFTQTRQTLLYLLGGLFLLAVGFAVVWFYSMSTLTITTNSDSNKILLRHKLTDRQEQIAVTQQGKRAEVRVTPGTYIVTVRNATQSSDEVVTLGIGVQKSVMINLAGNGQSAIENEPVASYGASDIAASQESLRFIDRNVADRPLYSVNASGSVARLGSGMTYMNAKWASPAFGLGFGTDKSNNYAFVKIEGDFVTPIKAPFKVANTSSYGVAPNSTWYISDRHTVYRGNADGSFTNVYKTEDAVEIIAISNKALLLSQKKEGSKREGNLVILHTDGTKYQIEGEAYEAAWSPSGDKLVTSGDTSELFDGKFNRIADLPSGNFVSPAWMNNDTLLYSEANSVMRYDIKTGKANPLKTFDSVTGRPSQITFDSEKNYAYVTIQKGGNRPGFAYRLDRLPLHGQQPADVPIQKYSLLIPNTIDGCELNYMNFIRFTITMNNTKKVNCVAAATKYFQSYNIGTTNTSFQQLNN